MEKEFHQLTKQAVERYLSKQIDTLCVFILYQPKEPKNLKQFVKERKKTRG